MQPLHGLLDMLVLRTLLFGPLHGYGVAKAIRNSSTDALDIEFGSLYPALKRLELKGWILSSWEVSEQNRRAKYLPAHRQRAEAAPGGARRVEPVRSGGRAGDGGAAGGTVMSGWRKLNYWISPRARRAEERDIQEELESLRQLAEPGELGNLTLAAEDARSQFGRLWFERLGQDLRYALRSMRHHKAFTTVVVASLALGIGANTAIYSFMEAIVLRPLPVQDPGSLVVMKWRAKTYTLARSGMMWSTNGSSSDKITGTISSIFPYPALGVFQEQRGVLSSAFGYFSASRLALTAQGETEAVKAQFVSGGYFDGMGVVPAAGRLVQPADDTPGTSAVAVLSERFSLRRFGTPEAAVGQTVRVNDKPFAVIGVAPAAFFGAEPGAIPDVYIPLHADSLLTPGPNTNSKYLDDHLYWLEIMGRLQPGVSVAQAQAILAPPFHQYRVLPLRRRRNNSTTCQGSACSLASAVSTACAASTRGRSSS